MELVVHSVPGCRLPVPTPKASSSFFSSAVVSHVSERERGGQMASSGGRKGTTTVAKVTVEEQICQAVQSTSNLLHLMEQSSPSQALLIKLPKNLVAKASIANNTGKILEQLPKVIASFDEHMESGLKSISDLNTVTQLLSNMENSQLQTVVRAHQLEDIRKVDDTCTEEEKEL